MTDAAEHETEPRTSTSSPIIMALIGVLLIVLAIGGAVTAAMASGAIQDAAAQPTASTTVPARDLATPITGLTLGIVGAVVFGAPGIGLALAGTVWLVVRRRRGHRRAIAPYRRRV